MRNTRFLLFDIGGTWTKVAVAENGKIISNKILITGNLKIEDLKAISEELGGKFSLVILACAGPVKEGICKMTNASLEFDEETIANLLKTKVIILNDLAAIAYGLKSQYKSCLVIEIGTGLGVSLISKDKVVIPSEEGHFLLDHEFFLLVPEFNGMMIPQYEHLLSGKNNLLIKLFNKSFVNLGMSPDQIKDSEGGREKSKKPKSSGKKDEFLYNDRFTEIYLQTLDSFVSKMLLVHKKECVENIIFTGGVISGNKKLIAKFLSEMKKKFSREKKGIKDIKIIDDEFLGIKGALAFCNEKQKNL
jgi:hypothetical protein